MRTPLPSQPSLSPPEPAESAVRRHAYLIWQEQGCPEGKDEQIWLEARKLARRDAAAPPPPGRRHRLHPA